MSKNASTGPIVALWWPQIRLFSSHSPETSFLLVVICSCNTISCDTYQFISVLYWTPSQLRSNFYDWRHTARETGTRATLPSSVSSSDWIDVSLQDLLNQWKLNIAITFLRLLAAFVISGSIRINDSRSLECDQNCRVHSSVSLMYHDLTDLGWLIQVQITPNERILS